MNSVERFFDIWKNNVIGNKDDLIIGLNQLDNEIRAEERRKFAEWLSEKGVINLVGYFCGEPTILELKANEVLEKYEKEKK